MQLSRCRDTGAPRHRYAHSDPMVAAHCQVILASPTTWHVPPVPCAPSRWTHAAAVRPRPMSVTCAPQVLRRVAWLHWQAAAPLSLRPAWEQLDLPSVRWLASVWLVGAVCRLCWYHLALSLASIRLWDPLPPWAHFNLTCIACPTDPCTLLRRAPVTP